MNIENKNYILDNFADHITNLNDIEYTDYYEGNNRRILMNNIVIGEIHKYFNGIHYGNIYIYVVDVLNGEVFKEIINNIDNILININDLKFDIYIICENNEIHEYISYYNNINIHRKSINIDLVPE
jgi:hypothetical protein